MARLVFDSLASTKAILAYLFLRENYHDVIEVFEKLVSLSEQSKVGLAVNTSHLNYAIRSLLAMV
jgi:hypothetical protein